MSYDGREFGWDFVEHLQHTDPRTGRPYRGGTDLKHKRGEPVKAYVTGRVSAVTRTSVTITPQAGNRTLILELGNVFVTVGDPVTPNTIIGTAGLKWPHYNDLLPAGVHVRAAFLTPPTPPIVKDTEMRIIYNTDNPDDNTRRALVGELSFQVITAGQSVREGKLWGATVNFTQGEWDACQALVVARRADLPAGSGGGYNPSDADVVDEAEAGGIATSTVTLVNQHADANKTEILTALGNLTLAAQ